MEPKFRVEFAPGCFDDFDGTEEELQSMIALIHQMAADGTIFDNSEPISEEEEQEILEELQKRSLRQ